jgi:hypothetical protein
MSLVQCILLRCSDGVDRGIGNMRGSVPAKPLILSREEHIVGVSQEEDGSGHYEGILVLLIDMDDPAEFCRLVNRCIL